jgi:hypothetical protein
MDRSKNEMSDRPRIRRNDPQRSAPIRDWSNLFRAAAPQGATAAAPRAQANGYSLEDAGGASPTASTAAAHDVVSEEARLGIETAYRVIDQHLQEGRRAAQARMGRDGATAQRGFAAAATAPRGAGAAQDTIQELVVQGIRLYSILAPLWSGILDSIARSTVAGDGGHASGAPVTVEIASTRMTRLTVDLASNTGPGTLAINGLHSLEAGKPPVTDISFAHEANSNRAVVRLRVPDGQPPGTYNGVIVDKDSGEPRGTITLRIDG